MYIQQPEGFEDGTNHICELLKSLYGLKQSGRAWNIEFNHVIWKHSFKYMCLDPCTYIRCKGEDFAIIAIWVDDLLLFATLDALMEKTKQNISTEWETTDLGEPSKIVGIKITQSVNAISIRQRQYVEVILKCEGMDHTNPVAMPLDPGTPIQPNPDRNEGNRSNSYACLLRVLPPKQVDKLLVSRDHCECNLEWFCVPYDSCFCEGSSSFPPVRPPCPSWSQFSYDWYCELASHLKLHPHSPLPRFGSEVE